MGWVCYVTKKLCTRWHECLWTWDGCNKVGRGQVKILQRCTIAAGALHNLKRSHDYIHLCKCFSHLDCSLKKSTKAQKVKRWQKHLAEHNRKAHLIFSRRLIAVRDGGNRESGSCFPPLKAVWWDTKSVSYNFPSDRIQPAEIWSNTCRNHLIGKSWKKLTL